MDPDLLLSPRAQAAIAACRMRTSVPSGPSWGLRPVPEGPQPMLAYVGGRPPGIHDGPDFLFWAVQLGFRPHPLIGDWPLTVVTLEPAPADSPVAALAYVAGRASLTMWSSTPEAQVSLTVAFPRSD